LADRGGVPLDQLLGQPLDLAFSLRLAIGVSTALSQLHQRRFIHKDIKPANILVNPANGRCWLTGFGITSRLPPERQSPEPPEIIAGTLAYMAPEQTGRMNRSIDSRSDLYSLGVTLYEVLTGCLPFTASDPMEWVHCHTARQPVPPAERLMSIPASVLRHCYQAARQDGRRALPDRSRRRTRSATLPHSMGSRGAHRKVSAWRTRHVRPTTDPREVVRENARDRDLARRLRSRRSERGDGVGAGLRIFWHRQVLGRKRTAKSAGSAARAVRLLRSIRHLKF